MYGIAGVSNAIFNASNLCINLVGNYKKLKAAWYEKI